MSDNYLTISNAFDDLLTSIAKAIDFKYLKSQRSLKKQYKNLSFVIDFYSSKWNLAGDCIWINAGFHIYNKKYGKLPGETVVASKMYKPKDSEWYDITSREQLNVVVDELCRIFKSEIQSLYELFEKDYIGAVEYLNEELFDEFHVYLDFIADVLGQDAIIDKANLISQNLSDDLKMQIVEYKKGSKNKAWMLNRNNIKYLVDNNLI